MVFLYSLMKKNTKIKNPHFPSNLLQLHFFPKLDKTKEMPFNFFQIAKKLLESHEEAIF